MVTKKRFRDIEQLQKIQFLASCCKEDVGFHSEDGRIIVDAKSFIGIYALDFTKPVLVVSENMAFHKKIARIGETIEFLPAYMKSEIYR